VLKETQLKDIVLSNRAPSLQTAVTLGIRGVYTIQALEQMLH